jgi:hypothetical protein
MPKENWCDNNNSAATTSLFILTIALYPKRERTDPIVTGLRAALVTRFVAFAWFLPGFF